MLSALRKPAPPPPARTPAQMERAAAALITETETAIKVRELEAAAAFRAELENHERDQQRATLVREVKATRTTSRTSSVQLWTSRFVPFAPLVLVNTLAVFGQLGWGRHNLVQVGGSEDDLSRWVIALLFAATLESIALFLAYYANRALDRGDSATALYLGAFTVAAIVAGINYSHYADTTSPSFSLGPIDVPHPSAMAVVFALCSLASPWLWRIKHRDANRAKLHELGVIDSKAVRLSMARKVWHPIRSFRVMWLATWSGETNPAEAVATYEASVAARRARRASRAAAKDHGKPQKPAAEPQSLPPAPIPAELPPALPEPLEALEEPTREVVAIPLPEVAVKYPEMWATVQRADGAGLAIGGRALAREHAPAGGQGNRAAARAVIKEYTEWKQVSDRVNGSSPAPA